MKFIALRATSRRRGLSWAACRWLVAPLKITQNLAVVTGTRDHGGRSTFGSYGHAFQPHAGCTQSDKLHHFTAAKRPLCLGALKTFVTIVPHSEQRSGEARR